MMNIEALVKKHISLYRMKAHYSVRVAMRAALTEQAAWYEQKLAVMTRAVDTDYEQLYREQLERANKLDAERVPDGWAFSSADFSLVASGRGDGRVALQRDEAGMKWWHSLPQELKDDDNGPALYVAGRGMTFTDAMNDACQKAMLAAVATQEQV